MTARRGLDRIEEVYESLAAGPLAPVWISLAPREVVREQVRRIESEDPAELPLYNLPFAIKDNIDLAGVPTTAGCPAFSYTPRKSATVVERLMRAGAVATGKTNLDQFATGLVGTRSPYGACSSVFDARYIAGGSSSGSAVAVASGLAAFSLGTDTAGSGRVPAAFNNLVGLKPTRGRISTRGVVPACRSLDCVSIFSRTVRGAREVWQAAQGFDAVDPYSRAARPGEGAAPWAGGRFRFGVPARGQLEFFGDREAEALYGEAVRRFETIDGEKVEVDFAPFREAAELLYGGPWVAERYAAVGSFVESHGEAVNPVVREIITDARKFSAADAFQAEYRLKELQHSAEEQWGHMDVLVLPTTGTIYRHEEVAADPIRLNTNLGYYTNFVNLLDLAAVAVPAGFRTNGLPFGISIIGRAFTDEALLGVAERFETGASGCCTPGCIAVAVVGAHLSGQPLNGQLTERGARLLKTCRTAPGYRLYALEGTAPAKPGLVRDEEFAGPGIEVEVWAMPEDRFGSFVAAVPAPLGIGNATLATGEAVKCFITEPYGVRGAREITGFGGWRNYLASLG